MDTNQTAPAFPIINLNGTSAEELQDQQTRLWHALHEAQMALNNAIPHGRDYQTAGTGAYAQARREHDARCATLAQMLRDCEQVWAAINDQVEARRAAKR